MLTDLDDDSYVDVIGDAGVIAAGLPRSYPLGGAGALVPHELCQPIGQAAWDGGDPGIACRSAATEAWPDGEELAWFQRDDVRLPVVARSAFSDWYWTGTAVFSEPT